MSTVRVWYRTGTVFEVPDFFPAKSGSPVPRTDGYVVPTGRVVVPTGRYVVPAGKDIIIVSPDRLSLVPTGRVLSHGRVKQRLMLIED
ncbi:hypothetical protein Tco_0059031 [Tanacetum coccineum]